jgi:hypothetical protein
MNIMTLQRYKNELILVIALLFALFTFIYKISAHSYIEENKANIQKQISEISAISAYQEQWSGKGMENQTKVFKTIVDASKVKLFQQKSKKLVASYEKLNQNELNTITNKLLNTPLQIEKLLIKKIGEDQFTLELTCKW